MPNLSPRSNASFVTASDRSRPGPGEARLDRWFGYYTAKRIGHQWQQVELLRGLPVRSILEVGPALGLVTAMLDNVGYAVTTLDIVPREFDRPDLPHIGADLVALDPAAIAGHDIIFCCETLEHLPWDRVPGILAAFRASGARFLLVSVPFEAFQLDWSLYFNRHALRQRFSMKKLRFLKHFMPEPGMGHKWEVGYRGRSLKVWETALRGSGWQIRQRTFTSPCRSVFHLLENPDFRG